MQETDNIRSQLFNYTRSTYIHGSKSLDSLGVVNCRLSKGPAVFLPFVDEAFQHFREELVGSYPDFTLYIKLIQSIAERFSIENHVDHIFLGHGAFGIAERLIHKLFQPNKLLGIGPQFNEIPSEFQATGGALDFVPWIDAPQSTISRVIERAKKIAPSVIYFDNPNNPTGYVFNAQELEELVIFCDQAHISLIIDEAFGDYFSDDNSLIPLTMKYHNLVVLRSFSKAFGLAPFRVGYAVMSKNLSHYYAELAPPFEPTYFSAAAAYYAMQNQELILQIVKDVKLFKRKLTALLLSKDFIISPTSYTVPLLLLRHTRYPNLREIFIQHKIITESLDSFRLTCIKTPEAFKNDVRMAIPFDAEDRKNLFAYISRI